MEFTASNFDYHLEKLIRKVEERTFPIVEVSEGPGQLLVAKPPCRETSIVSFAECYVMVNHSGQLPVWEPAGSRHTRSHP